MQKLFQRLVNERGTSMLEVLIALAIMGVVTTAIFQVHISQHKNYIAQEDITEIQQNARASIDEIGRNVRMAGFDVPATLPAILASNTNPDTITVVFLSTGCNTFLSAPMPQPSAELKVGTDPSCFTDGQWVYIWEPDSAVGEWFMISHVQVAAKHIQHNTMTLSRKYGQDAILLGMDMIQYYVDNTTDPAHPTLMRKLVGQPAQVFAENIIDLQFQYRMKNGMVLDEPIIASNIREVLIMVTGRSNNPDYDREGHDAFRHRTFNSSVFLRNIS